MTSCDNYGISDRVLYCNFSLSDDDFVINRNMTNSFSSCFNLYPGFQDANLRIMFYPLYMYLAWFSPLLAFAILIFSSHKNYYNPFTLSGEYCLEVDNKNDVNYATVQILNILNAPLFPYIRVLFSLGRTAIFPLLKYHFPQNALNFILHRLNITKG